MATAAGSGVAVSGGNGGEKRHLPERDGAPLAQPRVGQDIGYGETLRRVEREHAYAEAG